ncbi:MAG: protease pro-enzyme activation domain-containing protein [Candidatus Korobacteraceae bacterium]
MKHSHPIRIAATMLLFGLLISLPGFAQTLSQIVPPPVSRVHAAIIDSQVVTLKGHVHPLAQARFDRGVVADSTPAEHVILMLQRSPQQETAAAIFLDQLQNRNSPMYHQWLTPTQFGQNFGPTDSDIAKLTAWLQQKGFAIEDVPPGRTHITFSGTAGQMRQAFNAEFHNLNVNGEKHVAVLKDPTIPAALAPIVAGFRQLHDWSAKPNVVGQSVVKRDAATGESQRLSGSPSAPELTFTYKSNTFYDVSPQDWYTIYNVTPLLTASPAINGAGTTIALLEQTEIVNNTADVSAFRSQFGLPAYPSTPNVTQGGVNWIYGPGNGCTAPADPASAYDETEAEIDVQWAGVTAPAAIIDFVACAGTSSSIGSTGTDLAAAYVANYLSSTVVATGLGYGVCEISAGSTGTAWYSAIWQQMAGEGITTTVSAGDGGPTGCDANQVETPSYATHNLSTNAMASSIYNISAGGTDFSDTYQNKGVVPATYWNKNDTTPYASALSYIPEVAWSDYCSSPLLVSLAQEGHSTVFGSTYTAEAFCNNAAASTDGYLAVVGGAGGSSAYITAPAWQTGVYGSGNAQVSTTYRNQPDLSFFAASGLWYHALEYCQSDTGYACTYSNATDAYYLQAGGTSFVAPTVTGIMALVNQLYGRQGAAVPTLYALAAQEFGTPGSPNTANLATCSGSGQAGTSVGSSCIFRNIANDTPCLSGGSATCGTANGASSATTIASDNVQPCEFSVVTNCYRTSSSDIYGLSAAGPSNSTYAYKTAPGYNLATGLGSANVYNLVENWNTVALYPTTTSLVANPATLTISSPSTTLTATIARAYNTVVPTGIVDFYLNSTSGPLLGTGPLSSGTASLTLTQANVIAELSLGSNSIIAYYPGDSSGDQPSTSSAATVTTTAASQTITFTNPGTQTYGVAPFTLVASAGSGLPVTFSVVPPGLASISGSTLTINGAGSLTVEAAQIGGLGASWWYSAAPPVQDTFTVNQATTTINWAAPAAITYGTLLSGTQLDATVTVGGNPFSAGTLGYTPPAGTLLQAGNGQTLSVTFTPTDTRDYASATGSVLINVNTASQTITFPNPGAQPYGAARFQVSASASSGLPVSFTSNNLSICTVSGNTVTPSVVGGMCSLTATQGGNGNYLAAAPVTQIFRVGKEPQTITFNVIPDQFVGATNVPLTATSNSGLAVTIASQSPSICTVAGTPTVAGTGYTANMLAVGNCKLLATQYGNAIYAPAGGGVGHTFAVSLNPQTITFNPISDVTYGVAPFGISASTTANGLTVNLASLTPTICTLSSATSPAMVTGIAAGLCTIQATQPGDGSYYAAAKPVTQSFTVHWETQSITFAAIPNPPLTEKSIVVNPTSSIASLQVVLTSETTGVCTVGNYTAGRGYTVNLKAVGNCQLVATQPGTSGISAAAAVGHTFQVTAH